MAMGSGGSGTGLSADINVTPMIDVLLVLLIIFMITLPLSRRAFDVQVPAEQRQQPRRQQQASDQIVLELRADGSYAINTQPVAFETLDAKFHELYDQRPAKLLFIKAAPNRKYGDIVRAMDIARGAGVQVIGFTPPDQAAAGGGATR
jgi:biopolymer transport protein ExbD